MSDGTYKLPYCSVLMEKTLHPQYRDLGRKVRDFCNRGTEPGFSFEEIDSFFFTKKRAVRLDLGNQASSIDLAHMKRPSSLNTCESVSDKSREDAIKALLGKFIC